MELRYFEDFEVNKAIIHVISRGYRDPLYSERILEKDEAIEDFIPSHIARIFNDPENQKAEFKVIDQGQGRWIATTNDIIRQMLKNEIEFIEGSKQLAKLLSDSISGLESVSDFDMVIAKLDARGIPLLAIMKLDYKPGFVHSIDFGDDHVNVDIMTLETGLPTSNQRLSNCAIIKPDSSGGYDMLVLNKKVRDEEGCIIDFFVDRFLGADTVMDDTSKTVVFKSVMEKWLRRAVKDDISKAIEARDVVSGALSDGLKVDVADVVYRVADSNDEKESIEDRLAALGIGPSDSFQIDKGYIKSKLLRDRAICSLK